MEVEFSERKKQSKFMYPSCFDGYATLQNKTKQKKVQAIRERQNAAEERRLKAARRAMEHRMVFTINGEDEAEVEKAIRG